MDLYWLPFILAILVQVYTAKCMAVVQAEHCEVERNNDQSWKRMEVLPGGGWDNLRNIEMEEVFEHDYSTCQLTNDRKFLIPDGFFAIPLKQSNVETFSEVMDHWDDHTSLTSLSINTEANYLTTISGKFSADYTKNKMTMYNENSDVSRVQIRHKLYIIRLQAGVKLHPLFKTRLLDIAAYMIGNNTNIAHYLAELLVRDYGTHYTSAVHAGAILVQEDYFHKTSMQRNQTAKLQLQASTKADFFNKVGFRFHAGYDHYQMTSDSYYTSLSYSRIRTFGGPPFRTNFTLNNWEDGLADALVAIDREGDPLHYAIIPEALPELHPLITLELAQYVEQAIKLYYKHNTITGCTQPNATNFHFAANVDDGSCHTPTVDNFAFGGVFQTCISSNMGDNNICLNLTQKNPLTGNYTCPPQYEAVLIYSGEKHIQSTIPVKHCPRPCDRRPHCIWVPRKFSIIGHYFTYWCAPSSTLSNDQPGFLFGGFHNSITVNPITGAKFCPHYYYPLKFGEDTHICVSNDELGSAQSLPFGGFESCMIGNPLALVSPRTNSTMVQEIERSRWPHKCPKGYTQHLASMEQSCDITHCLKAGSLGDKGLPPIRRLPFRRPPQQNANSSDILSFTSPLGDLWLKNEITMEWYKETNASTFQYFESVSTPTISSNTSSSITTQGDSSSTLSRNNETPLAVALAIISTALIGLILVVVVYVIYKYKRPKRSQQQSYGNLDKPVNTGNEMETNTDI